MPHLDLTQLVTLLLAFVPEPYRATVANIVTILALGSSAASLIVSQMPAAWASLPGVRGLAVRTLHRLAHMRFRDEPGTLKLPGAGVTDATPTAPRDTTGQRGAAQLSAMAWALLVSLGLGVVIYAAVAVTGCTPAREAVMRVTPGVPDPVECTADTWRCHGSQPEHCSASGRWWPSLSRRADGSQRQCARGCSMNASGVASCIGPIEAEAEAGL